MNFAVLTILVLLSTVHASTVTCFKEYDSPLEFILPCFDELNKTTLMKSCLEDQGFVPGCVDCYHSTLQCMDNLCGVVCEATVDEAKSEDCLTCVEDNCAVEVCVEFSIGGWSCLLIAFMFSH